MDENDARINLEKRASVSPEVLRLHAAKRIRERYGIKVSDWLIYRIERLIQTRLFAKKICNQYCARSLWEVTVKEHVIYVVYDDFLNAVCTALDPDYPFIKKWREREIPPS